MRKLAIITGATGGIGKAIAFKLAKEGYNLALISRREEQLNAVRNEICDKHVSDVIVIPVDITNKNHVNLALTKIMGKFESIDVLVNSAGVAKRGTSELGPDDFENLLKTNVLGTFNVIHACIPYLKKQRSGYIINLGSTSGKVGLPNLGGYAASEFALVGYTESLYKELAEFNIKVSLINPSMVNTELTKEAPVENQEKIQPEDISEMVGVLLKLSSKTIVKEIVMQCEKRVGLY